MSPAKPTLPEMSERRKLLVFFVMSFGMFMALLDIQIVASSLGAIQGGLAATADEISRIQTSYLIAEVIMIPLSGWLSRMFSTRWLFAGSAAAFTVSSMACAFAWNIESMTVFRAIQGFVGGAMIPTVFATGFTLFSGEKQNRVAAILGLVACLAPAAGPTLGGLITEHLSWRWLFWINIVPGVALSVLVPRLLVLDRPDWRLARHFDWLGFVLMALFLGCLQYALEEGPKNGWLDDGLIRGLLITSAISGLLFVDRMLSHRYPLVGLKMLRRRNFALGCMMSFIVGVGIYCSVYFVPLYLATIRGYSAEQIGATVYVFGIAQILTAPFIAMLGKKVDPRLLISFGFVTYATSCWLMTRLTPEWGFAELLLPQVLRGLASMFCIVPITNVALGALGPDEIKNASGVYNLTRNLGGAIGLAMMNTQLFYNRLVLHSQRLSETINTTVFADDRAGLPLPYAMQLALLKKKLTLQALTMSFADVFLLIAGCFLAGMVLLPFIRRIAPGAVAVHGE